MRGIRTEIIRVRDAEDPTHDLRCFQHDIRAEDTLPGICAEIEDCEADCARLHAVEEQLAGITAVLAVLASASAAEDQWEGVLITPDEEATLERITNAIAEKVGVEGATMERIATLAAVRVGEKSRTQSGIAILDFNAASFSLSLSSKHASVVSLANVAATTESKPPSTFRAISGQDAGHS
jgi:hypothetical protein